jgi:hypothetical protein
MCNGNHILICIIACPKPAHCNIPVCTSSTNSRCEYCFGEQNRDKAGLNEYTGKPDDRICQSK